MIVRRDKIPTVSVGAQVKEGLLANTVAQQLKPEIEKLVEALPAGYRLVQGGEYEETLKSAYHVSVAMFISLILIVLTLMAQYNQVYKPVIILISVPFALTGVLFGLLVTGWAMGFMAMLGILALIGIVINNAIILIDFIEEGLAGGMELRNAVVAAGGLRMRPILLTTVTTIGGLLPLALFGGPLWAPMANGMIFGLIFSTVLTLILVPVIYTFFAERLAMPTATASGESRKKRRK
jgi:multidrug efflux pump subunit AcrB